MMKKVLFMACAALLAGMTPSINGAAFAAETKVGNISIEHAWARPSLGKAPNSAAFMKITNHGTTDDVLVSVKTTVAKTAELHTHINEGGVMRMRHVPDGIPIPAGKTVELKPGGYHVMMMGLTQELPKGTDTIVTLTFRDAGQVDVTAAVEMKSGGGHKHGMHGTMKHHGADMKKAPSDSGGHDSGGSMKHKH